jgi:hypothetical protein
MAPEQFEEPSAVDPLYNAVEQYRERIGASNGDALRPQSLLERR